MSARHPQTPETRLWRLVEEMGELFEAIGKGGRFGMTNTAPGTLAPTNAEAILAEMADVEQAIAAVRRDMQTPALVVHTALSPEERQAIKAAWPPTLVVEPGPLFVDSAEAEGRERPDLEQLLVGAQAKLRERLPPEPRLDGTAFFVLAALVLAVVLVVAGWWAS